MSRKSASNPFHPELRAARWLPRNIAPPWLVWVTRRVRFPARKPARPLEFRVQAIDASGELKVHITSPARRRAQRPVLLWLHGGGFVMGSPRQDYGLCARFAKALDMVVIAVDYRLAPEHPFPVPLEDCFAAYEWVLQQASSLDIDPERIVIGGSSAGGGLAAALALLIHDRGRPAPVLQLLVYPMLDDRSVRADADRPFHRVWNNQSNELGWRSYLGAASGSGQVSPYAAPARREQLDGLPPAWIGVGTLDLFYDENVRYAAQLRAANVPTSLEIVQGAIHGFDVALPGAAVSRRFFAAQVAAIAGSLGARPSSEREHGLHGDVPLLVDRRLT